MPKTNYKRLRKSLGPGILFASTAIGVSHLIQSTRAGAEFGVSLLSVVILANVLKYPFFEFGTRYAGATGRSLIDGYKKIGWWMLALYALVTLVTMWLVVAAVAAVTAAFLDNLLVISPILGENTKYFIPFLLLSVCGGILFFGNYKVLDQIIKVVAGVMIVTTVVAFGMSMTRFDSELLSSLDSWNPSDAGDMAFLIALIGWMPTAIDLSTWNSLWTLEKIKTTSGLKMKEILLEFRIGYWVSAVLAVFFVLMGAVFFYGSTNILPSSGAELAHQVVILYTGSFGDWSYLIIASAAFSIMFGTCLAVVDGYVRSMRHVLKISFGDKFKGDKIYKIGIIILITGSTLLIYIYEKSMRDLVDLATTASFIIAPVIAIANLYLVSNLKNRRHRPEIWMLVLSYLGIAMLLFLGILYFL